MAAVALGCVVALAAAELLLRALGRQVWNRRVDALDRPSMVVREPDPVLGWRNRPGRYETPYGRVTILPDGSRATSDESPSAGRRIVLLGGSFTFGQAVADDETFGWQLQSADPAHRYWNLGVGAYGTYQSLLMLERTLKSGAKPETVVYGYIPHHQARNVAPAGWLLALSRVSRSAAPALPYCSLRADGSLERHPPVAYPVWPLRETLVLPSGLGHRWLVAQERRRTADQRRITQLLLVQLRDRCRENGIRFITALLGRPIKGWERRFLPENNIEAVDCRMPWNEEFVVPNEGHPNGRGHALYARCIGEALSAGAP